MPTRTSLHDAIREAADPIAVLDRVVEESLRLIPHADGAALGIRRDAESIEYACTAGSLAPYAGARFGLSGGLAGLALRTRTIVRTDDVDADVRLQLAVFAQYGVRSALCVPLNADHGTDAALTVTSGAVAAFDAEDEHRLERLAAFVGQTIAAAAGLASVTAKVLHELDQAAGEPDHREAQIARFVANVMSPGLTEHLENAEAVEAAFDEGRMTMLAQPIVDLTDGRVVSCEALCRIAGPPDHAPDWWFAAAHRAGRGSELELRALRAAIDLIDAVPTSISLAANVGPATVIDPGFAETIATADLRRLTLELTEHGEMDDPDEVVRALAPLRARGMRLSIDDTGTGFSGLSRLLRLLPDVIKLDRELTAGIDVDPVKRALTTSLVAFARQIDALTVAEGVETSAELAVLRSLEVDQGQGFLFGRPMPVARLRDLVDSEDAPQP